MKTRFVNTLLIALIALFSFTSCGAVSNLSGNIRIIEDRGGETVYRINGNVIEDRGGETVYRIK